MRRLRFFTTRMALVGKSVHFSPLSSFSTIAAWSDCIGFFTADGMLLDKLDSFVLVLH